MSSCSTDEETKAQKGKETCVKLLNIPTIQLVLSGGAS